MNDAQDFSVIAKVQDVLMQQTQEQFVVLHYPTSRINHMDWRMQILQEQISAHVVVALLEMTR